MRIAVTGGGGFIGAATVAWANNHGDQAWAFDRSNGDDILGDLSTLKGADCVIHLAGVLGTSELFDSPEEAVQLNVTGTLRILKWCRENGAGYVGISMPDSNWANVYQATKLCAMRLATAWHRNFGLSVSHVRAFNAYGEGQKHGPGHPQKFMPTFATAGWTGLALPVWGSGQQTIDAVYVEDVAHMLVDATRHSDDAVFDAGTGIPVPVNSIASFVNAITSNPSGVEHLPMRDGEEPDTQIVARGAGWDRLGWKPELNWSKLKQTIDWYKP